MPVENDLVPHSEHLRRTASAWLLLGLASLVGAGLFSLLLVLARAPAVQPLIPVVDFFHVALVIHVNLSVLIWLLAIAGVFWALACREDRPAWDRLSFWLAAIGTVVVALSPLMGAAEPIMNNYVPVLRHPAFHAGLGLFASGVVLHLLRCGWSAWTQRTGAAIDPVRTGSRMAAGITGMAVLAIVMSMTGIPAGVAGLDYYEHLFWGGGHVLQFTHMLLMLLAWMVLASASGARFPLQPGTTRWLVVLVALPVVAVPFIYLAYDVLSPQHRLAFTSLMKYGGLVSLPLGIAVLASLLRAPPRRDGARHLRAALVASIVLFATGGLLGFMIAGLDIVIPAHYHGSTVGVTIAFMGLTYYLLPRLGFGPVPERLALWQSCVYGGGQLMHIAGLAWSGGYGVVRKSPALAGSEAFGEVASLGLMGLGGLVSVAGGLMFLLIAYRSIREAWLARRLRAESVLDSP